MILAAQKARNCFESGSVNESRRAPLGQLVALILVTCAFCSDPPAPSLEDNSPCSQNPRSSLDIERLQQVAWGHAPAPTIADDDKFGLSMELPVSNSFQRRLTCHHEASWISCSTR